MIQAALSILALFQAPSALPATTGLSDAVSVRGAPELTVTAAVESARAEVDTVLHQRWQRRADRLVRDHRPFWVPEVLVERQVAKWLGRAAVDRQVQVVDREDRIREHAFGRSYQTTLWIEEEVRDVVAGRRGLQRLIERTADSLLLGAGGTVVFWAVLLVVLSWLDRLSRGYMTGRLYAIGLSAGAVVPSLALLL